MVNMVTSKEKLPLSIDDKPRRRRVRVGDPDFVPPDGGWGWLIVFASGFSNLSIFPMFQQFGLIFNTKFDELGITQTQKTTVTNLNFAFSASVGLLNGPIFRKFTYRQVALFGSCLVAVSLFLTIFCNSFIMYILFYAICYGSGIGITQSANALALNTYFKEKRRIATGFSWSFTAGGSVIWPFVITALIDYYGMEGALLVFVAFACHGFMCSLLLQPVEWHTKFREIEEEKSEVVLIPTVLENKPPEETTGKLSSSRKSRSVFSSQYLNNEDDPIYTGYEITDPGTPMMVRSNDGWYSQNRSQVGSRNSLASNKTNRGGSRIHSGQNSTSVSKLPSYSNLAEARSKRNSSANLVEDGKRKRRSSYNKVAIREEAEEAHEALLEPNNSLQVPPTVVLKNAAEKLAQYEQDFKKEDLVQKIIAQEEQRKIEKEERKNMSFWEKVKIFFDFDLFKDPVYVNLMLGITVANFAEINFSILTPMVLMEFNFEKYEIATFMSLLGGTDILVRFFIPFIADRVGWDNKTFFLIGVLSMAFGRIILCHTQTFYVGLLVAIIIGAGKGLRTIFIALVIPGHVPLERLPAASGLQLATSGLLFIALGPLVGLIRDKVNNYVVTLHILNICTYATAVAWIIEGYLSRRKNKLLDKEQKSVPI